MKQKLPRNYLAVLVLFTVFDLLALFIRNLYVHNNNHNFLVWNLFLAFVPLGLAWLTYYIVDKWNLAAVIFFSFSWLLFYPNAPYMISDLIHVNDNSPIILYEALLLFSFAMLALFYGFYSLKIIHLVFKLRLSKLMANVVIWICIILSSAGIYLGRILRLNSWDFFTHPIRVLQTIFNHLFPVTKNPSTYLVIFLFSIIQFMLLIMMKDLDEVHKNHLISDEAMTARQ
jgi:uncharacterized membrane protein